MKPANTNIRRDTKVIETLYFEITTKKVNIEMMLAKVAPAPITINTEGSAQHIKVDEDANKDMKLADRSNILNFHQLIVCCILTIH